MKARLCVLMLVGLALITEGGDAPHAAANGWRFVDLSAVAALPDAVARQFSALPVGSQTFHDVPFRIDSIVAVTGMESARLGEFFPTEIPIRIGGSGRRIHLLLGTMFAARDGAPLARFVFHYADGGEEAVRLGYGVHARDWIAPRLEKTSEVLDPNSRIAWSEIDDRRGVVSRVFQTAIENPRPKEPIESVRLESLFSRAAPFILAMTVEGEESTFPANRTVPARKPLRDLREFADSVYRREIRVRVSDAASAASLTNAVVSLGITDDKETFFFGEASPDAQGVCRMPYPPQHTVGLSVWVHAADRAPVIVSESRTNVARFAENYSVVLKPGVTVGGVVRDPSGKAVAGAQIAVHKISRLSPHHYGRVDYDAVVTGADGKWTSRSLPDDLSGFSFQVTHPDYRPGQFVTAGYAAPPTNSSTATMPVNRTSPAVSFRRLPDGTLVPMNPVGRLAPGARTPLLLATNALLAGDGELILQPALLLEGSLVDAAGRPVSSAEVIVQSGDEERRYLRTDSKGRFRSRVGETGDAAVIVVQAGFAPVFRNVKLSAGMAPLEIQLAPARVLHGRVVDRNQHPVGGARVRLDEWNGTSDLLRFQTLSDAQGSFSWTGAPPDQATLYISRTNFNNTRHSFAGSMDNIVIAISGSPGVSGKVYDAETKKPVESFAVIPGRKYSTGEAQIHWDRTEGGRGSGGEYSLRMSSYFFQPEARVLIEAPGYAPQVSRALNGMDSYACDFALIKGRGIAGVVLLPNGLPAAGAAVLLVERGESGFLTLGGQLRANGGSSDLIRSDAQGRFEFTPKLEPAMVFVSHDQGYAETKVADLPKSGKIPLQKWGRVRGMMRVGEKGETDAAVQLQGNSSQSIVSDGRFTGLTFALRMDPGIEGAFDFEKVPPGEHHLAVEYRFKDDRGGNPALSHGLAVSVKPGATTEATLGGTGRRVTGRVNLLGGDHSDVDWKRDVHMLVPTSPGDAASQAGVRSYVLLFDTNGNFRVDNVPAGNYLLSLNVTDPEDEYYNRRPIGSLSKETVVPDEPNAKVNARFDIGAIELTIHPRLKLGTLVPSFEAKTRDGRPIKLSDFRGKTVILHLWGLSLGYSSYDLQVLKEFQNGRASAGKLAIIGCNFDADANAAEQFSKSQGMTWTQTYVGDWRQAPIAAMFGLNNNMASVCVLIDGEGRLASGQLRGSALRAALSSALSAER